MWLMTLMPAALVLAAPPSADPNLAPADSPGIVFNGDFELPWSVAKSAAELPQGWTIGDRPTTAEAWIGRGRHNGPSAVGTASLEWMARKTGTGDVRRFVRQDVSVDVPASGVLMFSLDVYLSGRESRDASIRVEPPLTVALRYSTGSSNSQTLTWKHAWHSRTGTNHPPPNARLSAVSRSTKTQVLDSRWIQSHFNLNRELVDVRTITGIDISFAGTASLVRVDNVRIYVVPALACAGDMNGDGVVDLADSNELRTHFGCSVGVGDVECDAADVNRDGRVNPIDLGLVMSRLGPCR